MASRVDEELEVLLCEEGCRREGEERPRGRRLETRTEAAESDREQGDDEERLRSVREVGVHRSLLRPRQSVGGSVRREHARGDERAGDEPRAEPVHARDDRGVHGDDRRTHLADAT